MEPEDDKPDWVDRLARLAGALGFNPVRVRWKLERWRQRAAERRTRAGQRVEQIRYAHKVCPRCGRVNDRADDVCAGCGARLGGRVWQVLTRIGVSFPEALSVSSLLGLAIVAVYARMALYEGGPDSIFSFKIETLFHFGGRWPPAIAAGEWWRLGTSVFMHAGIWHLGFNLLALAQIGPMVEELFGRGRMLLMYLLTGVVANLGALTVGVYGIGIGASGAIMGLTGMAAGWGQRDGTSTGLNVRNRMLKWAAYVMIFGYVIGADNAAHLFGFLAGGLFGFALPPEYLRRTERLWLQVVQALLGTAVAIALVVLCLVPPASSVQERFDRMFANPGELQNPYTLMVEVCALERDGKVAEALARLEELIPPDADLPAEVRPNREYLRRYCQTLDFQRDQCREFRAGGVDALYPPNTAPLDDLQRVEVERGMRSNCDWLGE